MQETVATLPDAARSEFKEPLGPVFTDPSTLLAEAGTPLIAVGDVVTYHLLSVERPPDVAVVDWRTERESVASDVETALAALGVDVEVDNDPATLSAALVSTLVDAVRDARNGSEGDGSADPFVVAVDGEEDLATLPAVLAAPDGASVVYGQPGEGMVRVDVTPETRSTVRALLESLDTTPRLWELLD